MRTQKGWSQEKLGLNAGLHRTYIGSIERSERNISLLNIKRLAQALNVPIQLLVVEGKPLETESGSEKDKLCSGTHAAGIYKGKEELFSLLFSYMLDSLKRKEKCVSVVTEDIRNRIIGELGRRGISVERCARWGQFILLSHAESYLKDGCFRSEKTVELLKGLHQASLREGFDGIRLAGDVTMELMDLIGHKDFIEYEARLNYFYPGTRALGLCLYDEGRHSKEFLLSVMYTHPKIFLGGRLRNNHYYKHPKVYLDQQHQRNPAHTYDFIRAELLKEK